MQRVGAIWNASRSLCGASICVCCVHTQPNVNRSISISACVRFRKCVHYSQFTWTRVEWCSRGKPWNRRHEWTNWIFTSHRHILHTTQYIYIGQSACRSCIYMSILWFHMTHRPGEWCAHREPHKHTQQKMWPSHDDAVIVQPAPGWHNKTVNGKEANRRQISHRIRRDM